MAGVRVIHPTQRNVRFTLTDPDVPYQQPRQCSPPEFGGCGQVHTHKTHHLNLDENGAAIVERELYKKIRPHLIAFGFEESNVVRKPPALAIGLGERLEGRGQWGNIPIVAATARSK